MLTAKIPNYQTKIAFIFIITLFVMIGFFLRNKLATYENIALHYSFQYDSSEIIKSTGSENKKPITESYSIAVEDQKNDNADLISIESYVSPSFSDDKSDEIIVQEIVDYQTSSTGQYLNPELNTVLKKPTSTVPIIGKQKSSSSLYRYEITWQNPTDKQSGTDVWLFIPSTENRTFIWLKYNKRNEDRLATILESLTLIH